LKAHDIYILENKYDSGCTKCKLHENLEGERHHFGMGHPNGDILVVIPFPYLDIDKVEVSDPILYDNSPMQMSSLERVLFSKILTSTGIDKTRIYVVPSLMCPVKNDKPEQSCVDSCSDRLKEVIKTFNPRVLVLCGPISYYSFYKKKAVNINYGIIYDKDNKTIFYTPALHYYTAAKKDSSMVKETAELAQIMFKNWSDIGKIE